MNKKAQEESENESYGGSLIPAIVIAFVHCLDTDFQLL